MVASVRLVHDAPKTTRVPRKPKHVFRLKVKPWQIQPFMIAPVMPGETMKNLMLQSRVVTDPLVDKLAGWWCEYYFFYVKHRDLEASASATLQAMHVTNGSTASLERATISLPLYTYAGGINYVQLCLDRIVDDYFRQEGDGSPDIDGLPAANINHFTGLESLRLGGGSAPAMDHELPGEVSTAPFGMDAQFSDEYAMWEQMVAMKMTTASFEDFLRQHGVGLPEQKEDESRPELIRYVRQFTYPTNTVEPTTGVPSSAAVWSIAERADKDRFFSEPGFLFGVQVVRPKVLFSVQKGALVGALNSAFTWLPPALRDQAWTTLKEFAFSAGPCKNMEASGSYWLDVRDLFVFGDQYVNYTMGNSDQKVALPAAGANTRFATLNDANALFTGATAKTILSDGAVSLSILGRTVNMT